MATEEVLLFRFDFLPQILQWRDKKEKEWYVLTRQIVLEMKNIEFKI